MYSLMLDIRKIKGEFKSNSADLMRRISSAVRVANFENRVDAMSALAHYKSRITRFSWGAAIAETFYLVKNGEFVCITPECE